MKKQISISLAVILAIILIPRPSYAASGPVQNVLPEDSGKVEELLRSSIRKKMKEGAFFVLGIEQKLKNSKDELELLRNNIQALEGKISETKVNVASLQDQLANIDFLVVKNKEKIRVARLQIGEYKNTIEILKTEVWEKEKQLSRNVAALDTALSTYYLQNNVFFDAEENDPSLLAIFSSDETTGEILQQNEYLFLVQNLGQQLAKKITEDQRELNQKKAVIEQKNKKIESLKSLLTREERSLELAQKSKERLLEETQGRQLIYETLLELSKKEIEQVSQQISRLQENYSFFQSKLDELKNNPDAYKLPDNALSLNDDYSQLAGNTALAWPVSPSGGLSAVYHDSAYEKALGIPHNAIDIRVTQGSRVKAAADGVVSKVADNGFGYSYVIIAHADKILTLYGHLSEILVAEGEIVRQGQTIGLSGGIPGTKGAGWLTTGAHLHLEVFKDFQHADPLGFLPLEYVPVASLPDKYLNKLIEASDKVKR